MKKQLLCVLLTLSTFSLHALPANAAKRQQVAPPGQWCFELPWMGLQCYDL